MLVYHVVQSYEIDKYDFIQPYRVDSGIYDSSISWYHGW